MQRLSRRSPPVLSTPARLALALGDGEDLGGHICQLMQDGWRPTFDALLFSGGHRNGVQPVYLSWSAMKHIRTRHVLSGPVRRRADP